MAQDGPLTPARLLDVFRFIQLCHEATLRADGPDAGADADASPLQHKLENWSRKVAEVANGDLHLSAQPLGLYIEATYRCNLTCPHCSRNTDENTHDKSMDIPMALVRTLQPQIARAFEVQLHGVGEPLLAQNLEELVDFIAAQGASPAACTNGNHVKFLDKLAHIAGHGGKLAVSLDSLQQERQEVLRPGIRIERVLDTLDHIVQLRAQSPAIITGVFTVATRYLLDEGDAMLAHLAARRPMGWVIIPWNPTGDAALDALALDRPTYQDVVGRLRKAGQSMGVTVRGDYSTPGTPCYEPWTRAFIAANGNVRPCCRASHDFVMGNLHQQSFDEIWNGEAYRELRRRVNGDDPPEECAACSYRSFKPIALPPLEMVDWWLAHHERAPADAPGAPAAPGRVRLPVVPGQGEAPGARAPKSKG